MPIKLLKLNQDDWTYFVKWWRDKELITLTSGDFVFLSDEDIKNQVVEMANDENSHHWLIGADDKVIGHINLNEINKQKAELQIVIGEKEYWGRGIGFEAGNDVLKKAKDFDYEKVCIEVRPTNLRAIRLYQKLGLKKTGLKKYPSNVNLLEVVMMERSIKEFK